MTHDLAKATKLRTICNRVGTTKLAQLIGVHPSLLRKKAAGTVGITQRDETAIDQALMRISEDVPETVEKLMCLLVTPDRGA
jgi:hypothetical protein